MDRKQRIITAAIILFSAVAILLAINPLEQIHQIQDGRVKADAQRFLEVVEDYYKVFFEYPWEALGQSNPDGIIIQGSWLQEFIDKGVVDSKFVKCSSWRRIYTTQTRLPTPDGVAYGGQGGATIHACFDPVSKRFQRQADEQGKGRNAAYGCLSNCFSCLP